MHKILCFYLLAFLVLARSSIASSTSSNSNPKDGEIFFSSDILPLFEHGYQLGAGLDFYPVRISFATSESQRPELTKKNSALNIESKTVGGQIDWIGKSSQGPYLGLSFKRVRWVFKHKVTGAKLRRDADFLGARIGWRQYFWRGAFFDIMLGYNFNIEGQHPVQVSGVQAEISEWDVYPNFQIGWGF